jgi:phospholipid-binding lipoprotein MlaA
MIPPIIRWGQAVFGVLLAASLLLAPVGPGAGTAWAQGEIDYSLDDDFDDITDAGTDDTGEDPLESYNRVMFTINDFFMTYLLEPFATVYRDYVPEIARDGVRNALRNLDSPNNLGNDLLQGQFVRAAETLERAVINSTIGVGGLMDVAAHLGIPSHTADFGQTLAVWGVGEGPYVVLPLFGPSNPRDAFGLAVDSVADPLSLWANNTDREELIFSRFGATAIDTYSRSMDDLEMIEDTSIDFYAAIRSLARQHRRHQIKYGIYEDGPSIKDMEK